MFFEKNAQALRQSAELHTYLLGQLQATEPTQAFELHETPNGHYTLRYQGVFLHSPQNPVAEAQEAIRAQCRPEARRLHLILGIGLGYLVDELFQASPGNILIYEPDLPLLRFVLDNVDLSAPFSSGRVFLASSLHDLTTLARKQLYRQHQLDVLALQGSAYLLADDIPPLMQQLTELELDRVHDVKTGHAFHFQWLEQFFLNVPRFAEIPNADTLFSQLSGRPALIISRGPSLDQALDAIRDLSPSTVLIAVGSAVRRLWQAGITPDFAVFYDANGIKEQLHGVPDEVLAQIIFLVSPFTQQACYDRPSRGKLLFLAQNNTQFANFLDQALHQQHQRLEGGGTVSLIAFQMALAMQCSPVMLVGQDLAFPNNQVYAGGISLELDENGAMALTKRDDLYTEPETMDSVPGQDGTVLPTLKAYKSFIRHFEDLAIKNDRSPAPAKLYNASLGGAAIAGYPLIALQDLTCTFPQWDKHATLAPFLHFDAHTVKTRQMALAQGLAELKSALLDGLTLFGALLQALEQPGLSQAERVPVIQSANRQLNDYWQQNPFPAYMVMFELITFQEQIQQLSTPEELGATGFDALQRLLTHCVAIYRDKAIPWLTQAESELESRSNSVPVGL